jgi:uncharacterized protein with FMN-binding domain
VTYDVDICVHTNNIKHDMRHTSALTIFLAIILICATSFAQQAKYKDGTYEAKAGFVEVSVRVDGGKIAAIEILSHGGGGPKYEAMVEELIPKMIAKQSTDVDAVSGATVSSEHLKTAVEKALKKSEAAARQ